MNLADHEAVEQLEVFVRSPDAPRWFRKRFEHHNRERRRGSTAKANAAARAASAQQPAQDDKGPSRRAFDATVAVETKIAAVRAHGLLWDRDQQNPAWTVREALGHARPKPHGTCVKEMLAALGAVKGPLPRSGGALVEELVLHILHVDLQEFSRNKKGNVAKQCLPKHALDDAAQVWKDYHKSASHEVARKALKTNQSYALLWNAFKRVVLSECGLHVVAAPSQRVYFEEPHARPNGPHALEKEGRWRQPVTAPSAWQPAPEDTADARENAKPRAFVRSAAYEQSMGGLGAQPDFEAPAPEDEDALECPDKGTKSEWDAMWPVEHRVKREACGPAQALRVSADRLRWVTPARGVGPQRRSMPRRCAATQTHARRQRRP